MNSSCGRCPREVDTLASLVGGVSVFEIKEKILNRRNGLLEAQTLRKGRCVQGTGSVGHMGSKGTGEAGR